MKFIADVVEGLADALGTVFKTNLPSYCDIETADTDHALVTKRGALVSGIRIDGMRFAVGPEEFESTVDVVTRALQSYLASAGHTVDIFASRDASAVRGKLAHLASGVRRTCDTIGLEMADVISANEKEIAKHTADESVYLALWSRSSLLSKREATDGFKELNEAARKVPPMGKHIQDPFATIPALRERHEATIRSIYEDLRNAGVMCELLTAHEMLRVARLEIDPGFTQPDWTPVLVGDTIPVLKSPGVLRREDATELEFSDIQVPSIARQLFPRDAYRMDTKFVVVGERAFAPVFVEIPPREVMPFSALFDKLASAGVPWRAQFRIDGGGLKFMGTKDAMATILAITSSMNRRVSEAIKDLKQLEFEGSTNVRFRISFCTWAPANNKELLVRRAARLAQTLSAWGQCEVREVSGDSMLGMMSTVPFVSEECAANASVAPLSHAVRMLPLMRPASPWKSGSIVFRTMDGRLMPFQPGSSLQTTWNYILFGRPGFGKSVQMLNLLLSSCMQPGLSRLPRVGIVDIGPSSQYFVGMIRDSLPKHLRHQAQGFKLKMSPEYAINPFDTPLGCRYPTPEHKAFIVNILTQVATPAESTNPYSRISELVSKVVDDVYTTYSDDGSKSAPKRYSQATEPVVDELLERYGFPVGRDTAWWHVVDFLFSKGHTHEATMAQRYAVPLIADCVALSPQVVDLYGHIKVESGQSLTDAFSSLISSALRDFPNLSTQTRFDIGEVRVAAINLEEVAKSGSNAANRQTAVMYLLASYALTKDYRLDGDTVKAMVMPSMYTDYHMKRVRETKEELKWIAYDEFHRTSSSAAVQGSVLVDMREGRKYNIGVVLSSQGAEDFPATMREFATGTFIVDAGSEKNSAALQDFFGFNDTARRLLTQYVNGPKSSGAPLLANITTKQGAYTQLLVSTLGLETRWALSTTSEDVMVREAVCSRLGAAEGRMALSAIYPDGAKGAVERLREEGKTDAVDAVARDTLDRWAARKAAQVAATAR
jgi:intracellular multiplication protein IcmB